MDLSIIIVNYNVKHFLEQCLHSVFKAINGIKAEVFVVDNNSVDGSVSLVNEKFKDVILIQNTVNTGFSVANNQAIKLAHGKYVLLLNPDTVVQEDTFVKCLEFMDARFDAGGLGIKMLDGKGNFLPESKRGLPTPAVAFYKIFGLAKLFPNSKKFGQYHLSFLDKNKNHQVDVLSGAYMLMRKEALDKVGLLDETFFMYGEDIDLSYRITKGGYKNYYFAGSSIIHYKGESTKKSSVNYVFVFYKAMAIFAKKHFSQSHAATFNILIHFAIYIRAFVAILARFVKQWFFPGVDFVLILLGLYFCKTIYEVKFKLYPNFYSQEILKLFFPLYTLIWMFFTYFFGGYDTPLKLKNILKGILYGMAFILVVYSLLPNYYRFSRALILIGSFSTFIIYVTTRIIYNSLKLQSFRFFSSTTVNKIAIVGSDKEFMRVNNLISQTQLKANFIGFISVDTTSKLKNHIGNFNQIAEVISIHNINELIFCAQDVSSQQIIDNMATMVGKGVDFKIAPPESLSIIGSNSIDNAGELYVIDVNNVGKPENVRKKRLLDIVISFLLIILSPVAIWFQKNKLQFLKNSFSVFFGTFTWVGYGKQTRKDLPYVKPSVIVPTAEGEDASAVNKAYFNYAKNYLIESDLKLIFKNFSLLGS